MSDLTELQERQEYHQERWQPIRREAEIDMAFVAGNPWTADDDKIRKNRPTVAPEEMGQYFNQVINALMSNPRGMKFSPTGNGASQEGARFYQNKAREIEYRSHATQQYVIAASNAVQRSYGYIRVDTRYASPRSANQELWIEGFPDPDMVSLDPDAKRPDSSDMQDAFVFQWEDQKAFKRKYPKAKIKNVADFAKQHPTWIQGKRVLLAEYWKVSTRPRQLLLVQPHLRGQNVGQPMQVFDDELVGRSRAAVKVLRKLRMVDYPEVTMQLINGLEILHEQDWLGKYIPIVSCYGKVLYVPEGGETKKKILSMTRFGRDPWKSYCYACSQELEVLSMVPKSPVVVYAGQLKGFEQDWQDAVHTPKAFLQAHAKTPATGDTNVLPLPQRVEYTAGQYLQAIEIVKEGFRRAIQAAMGSNFLPTQAQKRNEKSGVALDKIDQMATQGTFHFVNSFNDMIRQTGIICEDLIDKIYDYSGETGVMEPDDTAKTVRINTPKDPEAVNTKGDYLVTVSTGPNSDSELDAARDFTDSIVGNLQVVAEVSGPKAAAAVLAKSIRMRNLGQQGDQLADLIEPDEYKAKDGKPPDPQHVALMQENQQLKGVLQQAAQEKQSKVIEVKGKYEIAKMQEDAETARANDANATKLYVADIQAKVDHYAVLVQGLVDAAGRQEKQLDRLHASLESTKGRAHESIEAAKDRAHERLAADAGHAQAQELADQGVAGQMAIQDNAPQPDAGAEA